jgi:hypothetical protein
VPFSTGCALACVVVKPRANAVSAKLIVKFFRIFIVILPLYLVNLWLPSSYKAEKERENCSGKEKSFAGRVKGRVPRMDKAEPK